jgi:hypothetical protein
LFDPQSALCLKLFDPPQVNLSLFSAYPKATELLLETRSFDCVGEPISIPKEQLQRWPGATAYCRFLESCFQSLLATDYDSIWNLIGKTKPASPDDCRMWFDSIYLKVHELGEENSIEDI